MRIEVVSINPKNINVIILIFQKRAKKLSNLNFMSRLKLFKVILIWEDLFLLLVTFQSVPAQFPGIEVVLKLIQRSS